MVTQPIDEHDFFRRLTETFRDIIADGELDAAIAEGTHQRSQRWQAKDGWIIEYTTTRVLAGKLKGKFAVMAFRPVGKGARTGKATAWKRVYLRGFAKRKSARAKADAIYRQHSPA